MQTVSGAKKATQKILERNPNHFKEIGKIGGKNGHTGGFAANKTVARSAGAVGGSRSKRGYSFIVETDEYLEYMDKSSEHYGETVKFYKK